MLLRDGRLLLQAMREEGVTEDELLAAIREHGLRSPAEVELAVLETDGTISVIPRERPSSTFVQQPQGERPIP
jgi:uncharacterized membrane protein YcaP (DUF421 family)